MTAPTTLNAAESLVAGNGLTDQVLWNYLDDPAGLPRPSQLYWLPLDTWLAAVGLLVNGWRGVQAIFIALSALLVPLAAYLAWSLWGRRDYALAAGLLALFSGHYTGYWGSAPDSFGPFALAVAGAILAAADERWTLAGLATGLAALTRADGLLVGVVVGAFALVKRNWRGAGLLAGACLLTLAPWWARNWLVAGTPFPGGGLKTLWLRDYEELFYLGQELTASRYLAWGIGPILASKLQAGLYNAYVLAGGGWAWLAPFALVGAWAKRGDLRVRLAFGYGLALWLALTLGFTFPAQHGSAFHSASALVIWQAACVPAGIAAAVGWLTRWLRWDATRFSRYFLIRLTALAVVISLIQYGLIWLRVIRPELTAAGWVNHGQDRLPGRESVADRARRSSRRAGAGARSAVVLPRHRPPGGRAAARPGLPDPDRGSLWRALRHPGGRIARFDEAWALAAGRLAQCAPHGRLANRWRYSITKERKNDEAKQADRPGFGDPAGLWTDLVTAADLRVASRLLVASRPGADRPGHGALPGHQRLTERVRPILPWPASVSADGLACSATPCCAAPW